MYATSNISQTVLQVLCYTALHICSSTPRIRAHGPRPTPSTDWQSTNAHTDNPIQELLWVLPTATLREGHHYNCEMSQGQKLPQGSVLKGGLRSHHPDNSLSPSGSWGRKERSLYKRYRRVQHSCGGQAKDKSYLANSVTLRAIILSLPHESFRGPQSMQGGWRSALVELTVNYSLTQHRVALPRPHPTPYIVFRNVCQDCVPLPQRLPSVSPS